MTNSIASLGLRGLMSICFRQLYKKRTYKKKKGGSSDEGGRNEIE